jgi:UTP:GlnB (protein PII) uridylyltransferase
MSSEASAADARVWFANPVREGPSELLVEAPDRIGVLFAVVTAIVAARVKILRSEAQIANGVARDRFLLAERDGHPIAPARREQLRSDVLAAILNSWERMAA